MRRVLAVTGLAAVLLVSACGKKEEKVSLNRPPPKLPGPTEPAMKPPPGPALTAVSADGCAVIGAYAKHELSGDMGLPLIYREAADPKGVAVAESDLRHEFPKLKGAEAANLAKAMTAALHEGRQLDCDWRSLGVAPPAYLQPGGKDYIRFRVSVDGDVAILDSYTSAAEMVAAGNRCLYRRDAGGWTRDDCVLTAFH